ncbi:MAG: hypothetical protein IPH32_10285 [Bacteroidetes bacterium]|nr:hypothetical protein [Bacteroidota bacterium]
MFRKFSILFLLVFLSVFSFCKKKNQTVQDNIAYQTVNVTLYPNDPLYFKLQTAGGWVYYDNAGVNGLIIYRKTATNSPTDFVALERTSTVLPNDPNAKVKVQSDSFTLKDTISGAKWQIFDGGIISGASQNLRLYNAVFDGINTLTIRN